MFLDSRQNINTTSIELNENLSLIYKYFNIFACSCVVGSGIYIVHIQFLFFNLFLTLIFLKIMFLPFLVCHA